jgi:dienelactone hydrolase
MHTRTDMITTPNGDMGVYAVGPDGDGPLPVVVFVHRGPGLDAERRS